jgi:acyl-CoA synthetase (AMP-forming)/AMP-acid ligase II
MIVSFLLTMRADERFGSIPRMALASAERFGDEIAVVDGDVRLSFRELAEAMAVVGRALMASGVGPGDRVALWAPNSAVWMVAALGIQACGGWLVPLNTRFKSDEAAYIISQSGASVVMAVDDFLGIDYLDVVRSVTPGASRPQLVAVPPPGRLASDPWDDFLARADAAAHDDLMDRLMALRSDDVCDVIFTSGTTGRPKGVMLRHGTSMRAFEAYNAGTRLSMSDRHAIVVPFFHCFGYKAGWMLDLMVGAVTYPIAAFDAQRLIELIEAERITHMGGPPTLFQSILDHPLRREHDLGSLRSVLVSAASVDPGLIRRLKVDIGIEGVLSGYGLTESHALVSVADPDDDPELLATTVGRPIAGVDVVVVGDTGGPVPDGEPGEILVRGYTLMDGYYKDPDATASAIVDGWLHTGDVGVLDDEGYLRITDRKKDLYMTGGFNVSPVEVERVLQNFDKVAEVAVVGVPDPYFGEVGAAFVVARTGAGIQPEEVIQFARQHLANFKVPRQVVIVDSLPKNATGKVLKSELRRQKVVPPITGRDA